MLTGRIKHFERNKGWGFIETEDGEDYFFNVANVRPGQNLNLGDTVKFAEAYIMKKIKWFQLLEKFQKKILKKIKRKQR